MKHILFITSTNLASNPRCLKEVRLAEAQGCMISVVAFEMDNWTKEKERIIREGLKKVTVHYISAGRKPFLPWLIAGLQEKFCRRLFALGWQSTRITATGANRRSAQIRKLLVQKKLHADFIIAHNPGAFYPAAFWAKRKGLPYAIDVEDYHPGEGHDPLLRRMQERLMQSTLPAAQYVSYASAPIMKQVGSLIKAENSDRHFVINNVFRENDFPLPDTSAGSGPLQLFWFSQNIDASRGLEKLLPVLDEFASDVRLILVGNLRQHFFQQYLAHRPYIIIKEPLTQEELHRLAGQYDVGLAIEPGADFNNKLLLSNKIWVYFQAGLYIMATETDGQRHFMERFQAHGSFVSLEPDRLRKSISDLLNNIDNIRKEKQVRWQQAQQYAWEKESQKLLKSWGGILQL